MLRLDDLPPVAGVTHRDVQAGGVRLHVAEAGSGPPLLLLHGWPQHWWCWRRLVPELARSHRVIMPDLRGWGWSDAPPGTYDKPTFAADIAALLEAEGLERVALIGHDWGGFTAFLLALSHPERISRMIALDIVPPWRDATRPAYALVPAFVGYQVAVAIPGLGPQTMTRSPAFIRALIRTATGPDTKWSDEELDAYARVLQEPSRARASSACYRTFLTREMPRAFFKSPRRETLQVPTLLLMGGASFLYRTFNPQPAENLELEAIPRVGHFIAEEAPEVVLERARSFLGTA